MSIDDVDLLRLSLLWLNTSDMAESTGGPERSERSEWGEGVINNIWKKKRKARIESVASTFETHKGGGGSKTKESSMNNIVSTNYEPNNLKLQTNKNKSGEGLLWRRLLRRASRG